MALQSEKASINGIEIELTQGGDGPSLLYLHGGLGPDSPPSFLEHLAHHFRIIAPSHPGFGTSSWPSHIRSVSDLAFFYLDLADQFQLQDAILIGSCFGGWLAAETLIRSTQRFSHLILIDALGAKFGDRLTRDITDLHALSQDEVQTTLYYNPAHAVTDYSNLSDDDLHSIARNREAFTFFGWKPYMHDPGLKNWLHRIDIPTLVVWGAEDRFVSVDYAEHYAKAIPGSQLKVVPEAGHFPHVEQPEIVLDYIHQFVGTNGMSHAGSGT